MAVLDRYLKFAVQYGASDLHMCLGREPTVRLYGTLRKIKVPGLSAEENEAILTEVLSPAQRQILDTQKSLDFRYEVPEVGRFRANVYRQRLGMGGTFRVLPQRVPTLQELGLPPIIEKLLSYRQGLILVTGPAGSGKTTTLAAMINHLNESRHEHIITVEDPIEIQHMNKRCTVTQREVHTHTQSFSVSLRAALREDPDIILIGEMRDLETISIAITSAETGHLVLGTLHTPGAARTVNRVVDVFPPEQVSQIRAMVSESLRGVVSQQLLPRADGKGRINAQEILVVTPAIGNLIRENRTFQIPSMMQIGIKQGMKLMDVSLAELVNKGLVTADEATTRVEDPVEFFKVLAKVSGQTAAPRARTMAELDRWLRKMMELKGSDLHLRTGAPPMWRIHGHLAPIPDEPVLDQKRLTGLMREIAREDHWTRYEETLDVDFAYAMGDEARFRVNYLGQLHGYGCVLRHIPAKVLTLTDLGAPEVLKNLPHYRNGLVLVTGPTGSGKSTTLAAVVDDINRNYHKHIITIEDPIEFVHQNLNSIITQREVGTDTPEFAVALKDCLREDPDVILVGEMRDLETISLAITLAETGVLIFGTLHTNSAAKTIDRVIDVFPATRQQQVRTMLATSLRAIVAQQLLQRSDRKGRIAAHEILISSPALANIIREGRTEKIGSYIQSGRNQGMITMDGTLRRYVNEKLITGEEAYMYALDKSQFEQYFFKEEELQQAPRPKPAPGIKPLPGKPPSGTFKKA